MQSVADVVPQSCQRELAIAAHAEGQPYRRGLDRQAADVDGSEHHEQVEVGRPSWEVGLDYGHQRERILARADVGNELVHVARHGDDDREQEDRADYGRPDDGGEHGLGSGLPRVFGFLCQGAGGVEPVNHKQGHEHRGEECPGLVVEP